MKNYDRGPSRTAAEHEARTEARERQSRAIAMLEVASRPICSGLRIYHLPRGSEILGAHDDRNGLPRLVFRCDPREPLQPVRILIVSDRDLVPENAVYLGKVNQGSVFHDPSLELSS